MGVLDGVMVLSGVIWIILAPFGIAAAVIILAYKSHAAKARRKRDQEYYDALMAKAVEEAHQEREEKERKERERKEGWDEDERINDEGNRLADECMSRKSDRLPTLEETKRLREKVSKMDLNF